MFEVIVHDLRAVLRVAARRAPTPTAVMLDSRTGSSTLASGGRAGYDGAKRWQGATIHAGRTLRVSVDTLGHLLPLHVTPADAQDRDQVAPLTAAVQDATGETVEVAFVDQGHSGSGATEDAAAHGIRLEVVKHPATKRGFVLLPRRWVVERDFAWAARFRRLARDYERLETTLEGFHYVAFALLALAKVMPVLAVL